ncbi:MAG: class I SAM-dependent methyltransferase [Pseudomonadota bacterium]
MTGFASSWLDLREPADHAARNADLVQSLSDWARGRTRLTVVDLGCGTGSTVRALTAHVPDTTNWHLVDSDPSLLAEAHRRHGNIITAVHQIDLVNGLDQIAHLSPNLITASALFDLVSQDFIDRFVGLGVDLGAAVYVALTYDGQSDWSPPHKDDEAVTAAFHTDMRCDKGFGPALGPSAAAALAAALTAQGYAVSTGDSIWVLDASQSALIGELTDGIVEAAARHMSPDRAAAWGQAQRAAPTIRIGHTDILALPV